MLREFLYFYLISFTNGLYIKSGTSKTYTKDYGADELTIFEQKEALLKPQRHPEQIKVLLYHSLPENVDNQDRLLQDNEELDHFRKFYHHVTMELSQKQNSKVKIGILKKIPKVLKRMPRATKFSRVEDNEVIPREDSFDDDDDDDDNNDKQNLSSDYFVVESFYDDDDDDNDAEESLPKPVLPARKCCDFKDFLMRAMNKRKRKEVGRD